MTSKRGFKKFTATHRSYAAKVTLWRRGQINFNTGAVEKFGLGAFEYVALYYSEDEKLVGFQFLKTGEEEGAIKFRVRKNGASISAKPFLDNHDIPYDEKLAYDLKADREEGMDDFFVLDLKQKPTEVQGELLNHDL